MTNCVLGTYYDQERLENENKAFHLYFHSLSGMNQDELFDIMRIGKWTTEFQEIVENNLLEFIYNILPKYISCFANARIDGCVNIGVDDHCEITGIPYISSIPHEKIQEMISQTIHDNLDFEGDIVSFIGNIEFECVPLTVKPELLTDEAETHFLNYSKGIIAYNNELERYHNEHALFLIEHRNYSQKLEKMLNITRYRLELAEYIQKKSSGEYQHLVDDLESERFIKLKQENYTVDKERVNRDRIFYWIARFRDEKTHNNSINKPLKALHNTIYHPKQILSNLPAMRAKFVKSNPDIQYCMLKIRCPMKHTTGQVKYYNRFNNKWIHRKRIIMKCQQNGPSCI